MFEVVVLARRLIKDVHDHVAVVERDPLGFDHPLDADRVTPDGQRDDTLDLLGDSPYLAIRSTRGDDEGVKGIDECSHIDHHDVESNLLLSASDRRAHEF